MHGVCLHEHDILSILLQLVNVLASNPSCLTQSWHAPQAGLAERISSQETASSSGEVRAEARSGLSRWRFWLIKWPTWSVWASCQAKRKVLILALRLFEQLVAISDVSRERNKYEAFLQRGRHILPMSSFFPRVSQGKRGQKCSPLLFSQLTFATEGSSCSFAGRVSHLSRLNGLHPNSDEA